MDSPIVEQNGKKVFVGVDDPNNPPVFIKNPQSRYCQRCHAESSNDKTECPQCLTRFDDGKMECPICRRFYDYLLGDARQGCEGCYDRTKDHPDNLGERKANEKPGQVFDL